MACFTNDPFLLPQWPAPEWVGATATTRNGGVSKGRYASFNLGMHVGDEAKSVAENRQLFDEIIGCDSSQSWLEQSHSTVVANLRWNESTNLTADAAYTTEDQLPCIVMTADCLPILICSTQKKEIAAVHAGWRGLADGILENTISHFSSSANELMAWIGPAIGPKGFEVGQDVFDSFCLQVPVARTAFQPKDEKWLCNLPMLAQQKLQSLGVESVWLSELCTWSEPQRFFSYRRDGQTGRMATAIWVR